MPHFHISQAGGPSPYLYSFGIRHALICRIIFIQFSAQLDMEMQIPENSDKQQHFGDFPRHTLRTAELSSSQLSALFPFFFLVPSLVVRLFAFFGKWISAGNLPSQSNAVGVYWMGCGITCNLQLATCHAFKRLRYICILSFSASTVPYCLCHSKIKIYFTSVQFQLSSVFPTKLAADVRETLRRILYLFAPHCLCGKCRC